MKIKTERIPDLSSSGQYKILLEGDLLKANVFMGVEGLLGILDALEAAWTRCVYQVTSEEKAHFKFLRKIVAFYLLRTAVVTDGEHGEIEVIGLLPDKTASYDATRNEDVFVFGGTLKTLEKLSNDEFSDVMVAELTRRRGNKGLSLAEIEIIEKLIPLS
jgi:hypothetical protein